MDRRVGFPEGTVSRPDRASSAGRSAARRILNLGPPTVALVCLIVAAVSLGSGGSGLVFGASLGVFVLSGVASLISNLVERRSRARWINEMRSWNTAVDEEPEAELDAVPVDWDAFDHARARW
jgi:hypothetical protein